MISLDTNCVIYLIENNPVWQPKVVARLALALAAGEAVAVCDVARAECLVGPLRSGDAGLRTRYQQFFADPTVRMLPVSVAVCERAAALRVASAMRFEMLDCFHLAAAIEHSCGVFLTNDVKLASCTDIVVEVLR